jgi:HEAT repeat protein
MRRTLPILTATLLALVLPGTARPADTEEPKFGEYKASQLIDLLKTHKEAKRRRAALVGLEQIGLKWRPGVYTIIVTLKSDADDGVREAAARAVGNLAEQADEVRDETDKNLRKMMVEVRDACLGGLRTALKDDKSAKVREACAGGLGRVGTDLLTLRKEDEREQTLIDDFRAAVPVLTDALKDSDSGVRAAAAESLGRLCEYARDSVPALVDAFKDKKADRFVRSYAALSIGQIGGDGARSAVSALSDALTDKDTPPEVRRSAATAIGALKTDGAGAAAALGKALQDDNVDVRRAAAASLGQIGPEARAALADLEKGAKDEDKVVRAQVMHTLGLMSEDVVAAVRVLTRGTQDTAVEVRVEAIAALGNLGPNLGASKDAAEKVLRGLKNDPQLAVREAALEALKKVLKE